jgi:hypothetical protein
MRRGTPDRQMYTVRLGSVPREVGEELGEQAVMRPA